MWGGEIYMYTSIYEYLCVSGQAFVLYCLI